MQIKINDTITLIGTSFNLYQDRWTEVKNGEDVGLTFAVKRGTIYNKVKQQYAEITKEEKAELKIFGERV